MKTWPIQMSSGHTLKRPPCVTEPFVYGSTLEGLDWDLYWELNESFPKPPKKAIGPNKLHSHNADTVLSNNNFPQVWRDFVERHTSREFAESTIGKVPEHFCVRGTGSHRNFQTECQIAYNSPPIELGRVRGPHVDNGHQIYKFLLYFRDPHDKSIGGDLIFHGLLDNPRIMGKRGWTDKSVEEIYRIPYAQNSMGFFLNSPLSIHSVSPREASEYSRRFVVVSASH
ncbi:MAG: hypothetical protein J3T61_00285 [Candidatus Brocadiales bacterium]|nr:hypothetical protein [Candidatus Bathyanammoxibius sp.]